MKKNFWFLISVILCGVIFISGCTSNNNYHNSAISAASKNTNERQKTVITNEDQRRISLYITAMKEVYHSMKSVPNNFIAVKLETLDGLDSQGKQAVLEGMKDLSPNMYAFENIKNDAGKFRYSNKTLVSTKGGIILWVDVKQYKENQATLEAVAWTGNKVDVYTTYDAQYINGKWQLVGGKTTVDHWNTINEKS